MRIAFYKISTGLEHQSYRLRDGLDNIKLGADKISSEDYFIHEPKRLEFELLPDEWLTNNIFDGNHEYGSMISHYGVRLYNGISRIFDGIIDLSNSEETEEDQKVSICCYSKAKLFNLDGLKAIFDGITLDYPEAGYTAAELLSLGADLIESTIGIPITFDDDVSLYSIQKTGLKIWSELYRFVGDIDDLLFYERTYFRIGFDQNESDNIPVLRTVYITVKPEIEYTSGQVQEIDKFNGILTCKVFKIFNGICIYEDEELEIIENMESDDGSDQDADDLLNDMITRAQQLVNVSSWENTETLANDGKTYSIYTPTVFEYPIVLVNGIYRKPYYVTVSGNVIPSRIYPVTEDSEMEWLNAFKAALMLYNLTVIDSDNGSLKLLNKEIFTGNTHVIETNEIVSWKRKRISRCIPDTSTLEALFGNTSKLQSIISDYYSSYLSQIWKVSLVIDDISNHDISLHDKISTRGNQYLVTSIEKDYKNDEYKIESWEL